ncbi:MAG: alpha-glucan family phosphorylase [Verrucomicrobia bacterium]|jgi:glycogen phosphorylase|nr:alpha-glucan family phosphorylase [Verrucomicrobiota bacterium]
MKNVQLYNVAPAVPEELQFLETLSRNLWWCWDADATELFRRINSNTWKEVGYNPLKLLAGVSQQRLAALTKDEAFLAHMRRVEERFNRVCIESQHAPASQSVAYFSLEFGIHETVRIYSGGLGALAGDHLKAASDIGVPLAAVGLLYRQGYFQQYLNRDGLQQERYPESEVQHMPLEKALDPNGNEVIVTVPLPEGALKATVWCLKIGRVPLLLLDTNIPDNRHEFRSITAQLYGGNRLNRLRQELLLGIGGFRALIALGYEPAVCHMNEGHAAFLSMARIEYFMKSKGLSLKQAKEIVPRCSVFTTHTPVPAGNETFEPKLLRPHLDAVETETGLSSKAFVRLSQAPGSESETEASMTILGLQMAKYANGVSKLHGEVARQMWSHLWPGRAEDEVPIGHVTNGVHVPTWLSAQNVALFDRYIGPSWRNHPGAKTTLEGVNQIPDEELWRAHEIGRSRLIRAAREHAAEQYQARNASRSEIAQAKSILDHDALTIGFARRFATYKRGALLLHDMERFEALLTNEERPIQFLFAGKAHPADVHGKELIQRIVHFARKNNIRRHIVFLENYDIGIARRLVQGVDVWLNTPRRPLEASGTSGMKAAANGSLNASVLDGWWCEGYTQDTGWAIGDGEVYEDTEYQDAVEAQALYNLLENEIIPTFYDREGGDLPTQWIRMMKHSIRMGLQAFTSHRMVSQYNELYYKPAAESYVELLSNKAAKAEALVKQHARLEKLWGQVKVSTPQHAVEPGKLHVGDAFTITTDVHLGELTPEEVDVEVYYGPVNSELHICDSHVAVVPKGEHVGNGDYRYQHKLVCKRTGRYAFTTRVTPRGKEWSHVMPGFITWADES